MKKILLLLLSFTYYAALAQTDGLQQRISGRMNSPSATKKPYVVIISVDALRYDYIQKYQAKNLLELAASGVQAEYMIPSFPTVTRPNHFAIMSGLYPAHSGIVGNGFYDANRKQKWVDSDSSFVTTEPIWVTAEKQKILTASIYWPNALIPIQGIYPTYNYQRPNKGQSALSMDARVIALRDWLSMPEETRPHFMSIYLGAADHEGHQHGPESPELIKALSSIDDVIGKLAAAAKASGLPVNFIIVSDHGMAAVDKNPVPFPAIDTSKFIIHRIGALTNLQAKDPADILPTYERIKAIQQTDYQVYLKKDAPADWHYGEKEDRFNRVGDIMLITKFPYIFGPKLPAGTHGFLPTQPEMRASFYAWGPAFKEHLKIPGFQNIEVYEVMAKILGIKPLPNDSTGKLAKAILK